MIKERERCAKNRFAFRATAQPAVVAAGAAVGQFVTDKDIHSIAETVRKREREKGGPSVYKTPANANPAVI